MFEHEMEERRQVCVFYFILLNEDVMM